MLCVCCAYVVRTLDTMNTITFSPTIPTRQRRPDGSFNVKIRITFKRKSRFLSTNLFASNTDLTLRTLKLKQGNLLIRCNALIGEFQKALLDLSPFTLIEMDVDDVVKVILASSKKEQFRLDFFEWCDQQIAAKTPGARHNYIIAVNAFERFLGERRIDINSLTSSMLQDYSKYLDEEKKHHGNTKHDSEVKSVETKVCKKKGGASIRYIKSLSTLFADAQRFYNDEDEGKLLIPTRHPAPKRATDTPAI